MTACRTQEEEIAALRQAIARSGLSHRRFAERVLVRDERSLRRWLAGKSPIPRSVREWLAAHHEQQTQD